MVSLKYNAEEREKASVICWRIFLQLLTNNLPYTADKYKIWAGWKLKYAKETGHSKHLKMEIWKFTKGCLSLVITYFNIYFQDKFKSVHIPLKIFPIILVWKCKQEFDSNS